MMTNCKNISDDIRAKIKKAVAASKKEIRLGIIKASDDLSTEAFLKQKRGCGREVGIEVREYDVGEYLHSQKTLESRISTVARIRENDAVIIQLPFPPIQKKDGSSVSVHTSRLLNRVPPKKDADVLHAESFGRYEGGSKTALVPPIVGAMEEILRQKAPDVLASLEEKTVVIVGQGLVIGKQANRWAIRNGVREFSVIKKGSDVARYTREADIIVSGAGKANLITSDMIKMGAIVFDFGYSKENGVVCGDVDPAAADKARILTPVPGGMGPMGVTMLFWNVARIAGVTME